MPGMTFSPSRNTEGPEHRLIYLQPWAGLGGVLSGGLSSSL